MTHFRTAVISASVALTFAASVVFAQGLIPSRPDPEVSAAVQSMRDAMAHLAKSRAPDSVTITRARAYILLAASELATPAQALQPGAE